MTKLHKDIAIHMMQCVQSEEHSDNSTIKVPPALACVRIPHPYVMRMRISLHPSPTYNSLTILGFPGLLRLSVCTQVKCQESGLMSRVELSVVIGSQRIWYYVVYGNGHGTQHIGL